MIFSDLQTGNRIFLDANTLVYYFSADVALGPACRDLLLRVKNLEVEGFTSTHVIGEMAHRLMTIEAMRS